MRRIHFKAQYFAQPEFLQLVEPTYIYMRDELIEISIYIYIFVFGELDTNKSFINVMRTGRIYQR